jgi:CheY-like chemotaxis protein
MPPLSIRGTSESSTVGTGAIGVINTEPSIAGKRFLVLDDEFLIALDIQQVLESAGAASVICASNADDALKAITAAPVFDLGVLDFKLSGTDSSVNVAAALTAMQTPFVFLTGMRGDDEMKKFPNAPVVEKPYDAKLLIDAIVRSLGGR